jgi:hypothetical protein
MKTELCDAGLTPVYNSVNDSFFLSGSDPGVLNQQSSKVDCEDAAQYDEYNVEAQQ